MHEALQTLSLAVWPSSSEHIHSKVKVLTGMRFDKIASAAVLYEEGSAACRSLPCSQAVGFSQQLSVWVTLGTLQY
jgi:hypothetical protein